MLREDVGESLEPVARKQSALDAAPVDHRLQRIRGTVAPPREKRKYGGALRYRRVHPAPTQGGVVLAGLGRHREDVVGKASAFPWGEHVVPENVRLGVCPVVGDLRLAHL